MLEEYKKELSDIAEEIKGANENSKTLSTKLEKIEERKNNLIKKAREQGIFYCPVCDEFYQDKKSPHMSELIELLKKNASIGQELSEEEKDKVRTLIAEPVFSEKDCWLCKMSSRDDIRKAIYDTSLCKIHAYYAFAFRK
jgi:septal ring factor EnvC (AmiA/AmiB activator)